MCRKLMCLASFVLVLSIAGSASADLVAHWKLDDEGTSTVIDSSGNGHHGTLVGDAHFVPGLFDEALELDGDGDYVVIDGYKGIVGDGTNTPAFSITAWIRKEGPVGGNGEIIGWGSTGSGNRMEFRFNGGNNRVRIESGGGNAQNDTELTTGEWHHVALTVRENSTYESGVTFYLDGQDDTRVNADPDPIHPTENFDVKIGLRYNEDNRAYTGLIDEVRIYDKVLTITEVRDIIKLGYLASAHSPGPPDGSTYSDTWATLRWTAGENSISHDLYFGTSFDDVNTGAEETFVGNMTVNNQPIGFTEFPAPEGLVPGTTYYWRVDEINDVHPDSPWQGEVWSFWVPSITAYNPVPADGEPFEEPNLVLSWSTGMNATMHAVYFGTDAGEVDSAAGAPPYMETTYEPGLLNVDTTYYWRVDTFNGAEWIKGHLWSFTTMPEIPLAADPNLVLWYNFNEGAGTNALDWSGHGNHGRLYGPEWLDHGWIGQSALNFGEEGSPYVAIKNMSYNDANNPEVTVCAWIRTNDPNHQMIASFDRNEFWRLEINTDIADAPVSDGQIGWHVMTSSGDQQVDYGSFTRVDDGQWHHVCGVFDNGRMTIYIDGNPEPSAVGAPTFGDEITRFGFIGVGSEATEFNGIQGPFNNFNGDMDEVRIYDKALTQAEIVEVMRGDPLLAWDLQPPSGIFDIDSVPSSLTWKPGDMAVQHDIYFGTDGEVVNSAEASDTTGVYRGRQSGTTYIPPEGFAWGQSYYWRIDEFNTDGTITKGGVRAIIVADFIGIEDFEDYNDYPPDEIFNTWIDGWQVPTNGSTAGYPDPNFDQGEHFVETNIVHGGHQSMPLFYDNNFKYSEATMTLVSVRNWTKHGVGVLSLWFRGDASNAAEPMYVALNGSAVVYHDNPDAALVDEWTEWTIDLQEFAAQGVNLANVNTISIGFGDKNNLQPGGSGMVLFDDIRLYRPAPPETP